VPQPDPVAAAAAVKRTTALLRDVRSVLRRLDAVLATARAHSDSSEPAIAEVREAVERLVTQLAFREQAERRQARQAVRHIR
jgi:hypothetical protein